MTEAGTLASNGRYADARAVYLWVLARDAGDPEALFGLARLDSWGGCWSLAEDEYRRVLRAHPEDADVRAGYVDLLVWSGRLARARATLAEGLAIDPNAAVLVARAGRFAWWDGDATAAIAFADRAERAAPDDGDVRAIRDPLFLGEARITGHLDSYPSGYQNLYSIAAQGLQRAGRFDFSGGAEMIARYTGADANQAARDGRYPFSVAYHPGTGATVGIEIAPGAPARAIPRIALKGWAMAPVTGPVDASLAYSFWYYDAGGQTVHTLNPTVGVYLPSEIRLELRGWISAVTLPGNGADVPTQTRVEGAAGIAATWTASPRLSAGVTYTYGEEADPVVALYQLLAYQSHAATVFVDWLMGRRGGLRPLVGLEYRMPADITVWSFELGAYGRW